MERKRSGGESFTGSADMCRTLSRRPQRVHPRLVGQINDPLRRSDGALGMFIRRREAESRRRISALGFLPAANHRKQELVVNQRVRDPAMMLKETTGLRIGPDDDVPRLVVENGESGVKQLLTDVDRKGSHRPLADQPVPARLLKIDALNPPV